MGRGIGWRVLAPYGVLAILVGLAYGAALGNGYVWDDRYFLTDYTRVRSYAEAFEYAFKPLFEGWIYLRPLPILLIHLEALATGHSPVLSHLVNLLIHLACAVLVLALARGLVARRAGAVWRGLPLVLASAFAIHPALSENVAWVSSRFDLMVTLFMLAGLLVSAQEHLAAGRRALCLGLLFFLAALCKESAVVFPPVLALYTVLLAAARDGWGKVELRAAFTRREWLAYAVLFLAGLLYLGLRAWLVPGGSIRGAGGSSLEQHLVMAGLALFKYAKLTLLPFVGNSPAHSFNWAGPGSWSAYALPLGLAAAGVLAMAVGLLRRRAWGWWLLAWVLAYGPVLHLLPLNIAGNIITQRFMYFPTALLLATLPAVLPALALSRPARRLAVVVGAGLALAAILVCRSIVPVWANDLALWRWAVAMDPGSLDSRENLIWAYIIQGDLPAAEAELRSLAEAGMETSVNVAVNLGAAYFSRGYVDEARYYYEKARSAGPGPDPMRASRLEANLASVYLVQSEHPQAYQAISGALELDPRNQLALAQLLLLCGEEGLERFTVRESDLAVARSMLPTLRQNLVRRGAPQEFPAQACEKSG